MSTYSKVLCAASLFVGLFLVFFGHRYFQLEMFLVGFTMFAGVSYVLFVNHFETNAVGKRRVNDALRIPQWPRNAFEKKP